MMGGGSQLGGGAAWSGCPSAELNGGEVLARPLFSASNSPNCAGSNRGDSLVSVRSVLGSYVGIVVALRLRGRFFLSPRASPFVFLPRAFLLAGLRAAPRPHPGLAFQAWLGEDTPSCYVTLSAHATDSPIERLTPSLNRALCQEAGLHPHGPPPAVSSPIGAVSASSPGEQQLSHFAAMDPNHRKVGLI